VEYTGIDIDKEALLRVPKWGLCRVLASGKRLPFMPRPFDLVFSCTVLMHQESISEMLREMVRASQRWLILLEARKKLPFAYLHEYEKDTTRFGLICREIYKLKKSPLSLWLFEK